MQGAKYCSIFVRKLQFVTFTSIIWTIYHHNIYETFNNKKIEKKNEVKFHINNLDDIQLYQLEACNNT